MEDIPVMEKVLRVKDGAVVQVANAGKVVLLVFLTLLLGLGLLFYANMKPAKAPTQAEVAAKKAAEAKKATADKKAAVKKPAPVRDAPVWDWKWSPN